VVDTPEILQDPEGVCRFPGSSAINADSVTCAIPSAAPVEQESVCVVASIEVAGEHLRAGDAQFTLDRIRPSGRIDQHV
jgi:hypothetical protein